MCFSKTHAAKQYHIAFIFDEFESEEVLHLLLVDFFRPAPFELFQGFDLGETCLGYPAFDGAIVALMRLCLDQFAQILDMGPLFLSRLFCQWFVIFPDKWSFR